MTKPGQNRSHFKKAIQKLKIAKRKREEAIGRIKKLRSSRKFSMNKYLNGTSMHTGPVTKIQNRIKQERAIWGKWRNRTEKYKKEVEDIKSSLGPDSNCDQCGYSGGKLQDDGYVYCDSCFDRVQ